jgi:hypothetical protein
MYRYASHVHFPTHAPTAEVQVEEDEEDRINVMGIKEDATSIENKIVAP